MDKERREADEKLAEFNRKKEASIAASIKAKADLEATKKEIEEKEKVRKKARKAKEKADKEKLEQEREKAK